MKGDSEAISDFSVLKHSLKATFDKILEENRFQMPELPPSDSESDDEDTPVDVNAVRAKIWTENFGDVNIPVEPIKFERKISTTEKNTAMKKGHDSDDEFDDLLKQLQDPARLFSAYTVTNESRLIPSSDVHDDAVSEVNSVQSEDVLKAEENIKQAQANRELPYSAAFASILRRPSGPPTAPDHTPLGHPATIFPADELTAIVRRHTKAAIRRSGNVLGHHGGSGSHSNAPSVAGSSSATGSADSSAYYSTSPLGMHARKEEVREAMVALTDADLKWLTPFLLPLAAPRPSVAQVAALDALLSLGRTVALQMVPVAKTAELTVGGVNLATSGQGWTESDFAVVVLLAGGADEAIDRAAKIVDACPGGLGGSTAGLPRLSAARMVRMLVLDDIYSSDFESVSQGRSTVPVPSTAASADPLSDPIEELSVALIPYIDAVGTPAGSVEGLFAALADNHLVLTGLRSAYVSPAALASLDNHAVSALFREGMVANRAVHKQSGRARLVLGIAGRDAISKWNFLVGPRDPQVARRIEEHSLNARFASARPDLFAPSAAAAALLGLDGMAGRRGSHADTRASSTTGGAVTGLVNGLGGGFVEAKDLLSSRPTGKVEDPFALPVPSALASHD